MSETIEHQGGTPGGDIANEDDVRRTLQELQRKHEGTERELASERTRRLALESNLANETVARTSAEVDRDQHAARVSTEAELRWNAEKGQTTTAISSAEQTLASAEEAYARHAELGEWKEAAKAQRMLAEQTATLVSLRQKEQWLETNKEKLVPKPAARSAEAPRRQAEQPVRTPAAPNHKYAEHISGELVGGEEAWLDARPQFRNDQSFRDDVLNASAMAARKHARGTEGYFREMERIIGEEPAPREATAQPAAQPTRPGARQTQSADLPASRRAAPGETPAASRGEVRLTADEVEVADGLYGDPNSDWYIADTGQRYTHYAEMKARKNGRT